jgi:23S rRNA pseudouridine1911/1915/1917 synthase
VGLSDGSAADRPGIVHRLDKDTSGVLMVARTNPAHHALARLFMRREVEKRYLALCAGAVPKERDRIEAPVGRSRTDPLRFCVRAGGLSAATEYSLLHHACGISVLSLRLLTGRTHQIRVHCSHKGFPVLGDGVYGGGREIVMKIPPAERPFAYKIFKCFGRQALQAHTIAFSHPFTGEKLELRAPLPEDFRRALVILGITVE